MCRKIKRTKLTLTQNKIPLVLAPTRTGLRLSVQESDEVVQFEVVLRYQRSEPRELEVGLI